MQASLPAVIIWLPDIKTCGIVCQRRRKNTQLPKNYSQKAVTFLLRFC